VSSIFAQYLNFLTGYGFVYPLTKSKHNIEQL